MAVDMWPSYVSASALTRIKARRSRAEHGAAQTNHTSARSLDAWPSNTTGDGERFASLLYEIEMAEFRTPPFPRAKLQVAISQGRRGRLRPGKKGLAPLGA